MDKETLFNPFPKQVEFMEAVFSGRFSFVLFGGAIRGGKTFAGIGTLILLCKIYPQSRWAIVRDSLPTLKRNTIPSFWKVCPKSFVQGYNQETQIVTFTNGSQIMFFSENYDQDKELNRWKGLEVNGFLFEEINEMRNKTFLKGIERAGSHIMPEGLAQPPSIILGTCNPTTGWVREQVYYPWKNGELKSSWTYIQSKITDNPYIPEDYKESLKNLPAYEYEVFVNGNWDIELKTGGEFYKCFSIDNHTGRTGYDPNKPLHISFDENVNPYITATAYQIHDGKHIKQVSEFCYESPRNTVKELCKGIAAAYQGHQSGLFVYGDATSRKQDTKLEKGHNFFTLIMDNLQEFNPALRVPASNPSIVMRGNFINQVLEKGFNSISIEINRECKKSVEDFNNCKEAPDGKKAKIKERNPETKVSFEKHGHTSDTFDYFICKAFESDYEIYRTGRRDFNHVSMGGVNIRRSRSY